MARKRKSSVKAIKKKPPIKKKDKIEVEDNLSSITGDSSDSEAEKAKGEKDTRIQEQALHSDEEDENLVKMFKIELPDTFDSFADFSGYLDPAVKNIEQYISQKKVKEGNMSEEEEEKDDDKEELSSTFNFYGALLKNLLVAALSHDALIFKLYQPEVKKATGRNAKDQVAYRDIVKEDFLALIKKKKLKTLEGCKLKLDLERNESVEFSSDTNDGELKKTLKELIQKYDNVLETVDDKTFRRTYFGKDAPQEEDKKTKKKQKGKKKEKSVEPVKIPMAEKIKKLGQDLREALGKAPEGDMEVEDEKPKRGKKPAKKKNTAKDAIIGGAYDILTPKQVDELDEDMIETNMQEQELRERLINEFNSPQEYYQKLEDGSIKFISKLLDGEKITHCSIYTLLLICVVLGRRIALAEQELIDQESLEDLLEVPRYLPLPVSHNLSGLHTKQAIAKALDLMLEDELLNCMPHSTYHKVLKSFKEETHEMNVVSAKVCPLLSKLYHHKSSLVSTETHKKLEAYKQQLDALIKIYKYFVEEINYPKVGSKTTPKSSKISQNRVHKIYTEVKQVPGMEEYNELEFLKTEFNIKDTEEVIEETKVSKGKDKGRVKSLDKQTEETKMAIEEPAAKKPEKESVTKSEKGSVQKESTISTRKQTPSKDKTTKSESEPVYVKTEQEKMKEYEDELHRQMKVLMSKITVDQARKKLNELGKNHKHNEKEINNLEEQIKKAEDWVSRYHEAILEKKNLSKGGEIVNKIDDLELRTEEMVALFDKYIRYRLWKNKFGAALKSLKKSWKTPSKNVGGGDGITEFSKFYSGMLTLREAEELLDEAAGLTLEPSEETKLKELKTKAALAQDLQKKLAEELPDLYDVKTLLGYENDIKYLKIKLPQLETIHKRRVINQNAIDVIEETTGIEQVEQFLKDLSSNSLEIDNENYNKLKLKLSEGRRLRQIANLLSTSHKEFYYHEVNEIRSVVKEIEDLKVTFEELDRLRNILKMFAWLLKLYHLIRGEKEDAQQYEQLFLKKLDTELPFFNTDEVVDYCNEFLEEKGQEAQGLAPLKQTIESGENIPMADPKIEKLFNSFSSQMWLNESERFLSRSRTTKELERFLSEGSKKLLTKLDHETLSKLYTEAEKVKDWKKNFEELSQTNVENYIRTTLEKDLKETSKKDKVSDLKWKLTKLKTEFTVDLSKYSDLEKNNAVVQKYLNWITWCSTVEETIKNVNKGKKIGSYDDLEQLYNEAKECQVPKSSEYYKTVENWFAVASEVLRSYRIKFENDKINDVKKSVSKSVGKDSAKKVVEKLRVLPSQSEAIKAKNDLEDKAGFVSFKQEIDHLNKSLKAYEKWQGALEELVYTERQRLLESASEKDDLLDDYEQINREIGHLKLELSALDLRNPEDELKLTDLEWQYKTYVLMKKRNKEAIVDEWKRLISYITDRPEADPTPNKILTKFLKDEMLNSKKLHKIVKGLKKKEKSTEINTPDDAEKLLMQLRKSLIKLPDDESFLLELTAKCKKLILRANQLVKSKEKEPIIEFTKTLDQIKHLPFTFKSEEDKIEGVINIANKLATKIQKGNILDLDAVENLLEQYAKCPVLITEVQKLKENYEESQKNYQFYQEGLCDLIGNYMSATFEEIQDMSRKLDGIKWDHDGQLIQKKMQVFILKIEHLQKYDSDELNQPTTPITYQTLKGFLVDGRNLRKQITDNRNLDEVVAWTENIVRRVEERVEELKTIKSVEALGRIPKVILGFVDYSQEIVERKAAIIAGQHVPLSQRLAKRGMDIEEEGTITTSKSPKKDDKKKGGKEEKKKASDAVVIKAGSPVETVKELLEKNDNLLLSNKEAQKHAEKIANGFPIIKKNKERLGRFITLLKDILKHSNIARNLLSLEFDPNEIKHLLKRSNNELTMMDRRLDDPSNRKIIRFSSKEEEGKKKVKTADTAKNMLDTSNQFNTEYREPIRPSMGSTQTLPILSQRAESQDLKPMAAKKYFSIQHVTNEDNLVGNLSFENQREFTNKRQPEYRKDTPTKFQNPNGIIKIFSGLLKTPEEKYNSRVGFYSLARLDKIEQLPRIVTDFDGSFKILGYLSADKCNEYLNDLINADMSGTFAINGWVEDERGDFRSNCQQIAQELLNRGSVGMTKYLDCAKIFFMHRDQIPSQWSQRFAFKTRKVSHTSPFPRLAFILIYQPAKSSVDAELIDKIFPQIVPPFQDFQRSDLQFQPQQREFRSNYNPRGRSDRSDISPKQQPVINIKPEFINMDSNGIEGNSNTFSTYQGSQRPGRPQENQRFETSYSNDPYNEPTHQQRDNFKNQTQSFNQGRNQGARSPGGFQGGGSPGGYQGSRSPGGFQGGRSPGGFQGGRSPGGFQGDRSSGGFQGGRSAGGFQGGRSVGGFQGRTYSYQQHQQQPRNQGGSVQRQSQQGQFKAEGQSQRRESQQFDKPTEPETTQIQDESLEPGEISASNFQKGPNRGPGQRRDFNQKSSSNVPQNPLYHQYLKNKNADNKPVAPSSVIQKYLKPNKATASPSKLNKGITKPSETNNLLLEDDLNYEQKPQNTQYQRSNLQGSQSSSQFQNQKKGGFSSSQARF